MNDDALRNALAAEQAAERRQQQIQGMRSVMPMVSPTRPTYFKISGNPTVVFLTGMAHENMITATGDLIDADVPVGSFAMTMDVLKQLHAALGKTIEQIPPVAPNAPSVETRQ